jgi:hypothetical protein
MAEDWFNIADLSHFWIRRRFEIFRRLMQRVPLQGKHIAEIGCGNGLLQAQLKAVLGIVVDGFDLNIEALKKNQAEAGSLYYYDILERHVAFEERYSSIFLFDVLEHIQDEDAFLRAALFHLSKDGVLYVNVPALHVLYSAYDIAAGHVRRYNIETLRRIAARNGLTILEWTYWGLPLIPLLFLRKLLLASARNQNVIQRGFDPGTVSLNEVMMVWSRCEWIPQKISGTSLMAALKRQTKPSF